MLVNGATAFLSLLLGAQAGTFPRTAELTDRVVAAAVSQTTAKVKHDGAYRRIPYPGGDVPGVHRTRCSAYYEACRSRGATIVMDIGDRPWGMRDFRVIDPSGNRIGFGATESKGSRVSATGESPQ